MKEYILQKMREMTIPNARKLYRYAYVLVIAQKHRRDPHFQKEPFPPVPQLRRRMEEILDAASEGEMCLIRKMAQVLDEIERRKREK